MHAVKKLQCTGGLVVAAFVTVVALSVPLFVTSL